MAKYKVKHTSIMHNKKVYAEGSIIELTDVQAERLADFVEILSNQPTEVKLVPQSQAKSKSKIKKVVTETKTETEIEKSNDKPQVGEVPVGGEDNDE